MSTEVLKGRRARCSGGRSSVLLYGGLWLAICALLITEASPLAAQSAPVFVGSQRLGAALDPTGVEHVGSLGWRSRLDESTDPLWNRAHIEAGVLSALSPIDLALGAYGQWSPISILVLRGEASLLQAWPIGMDGAGYFPLDGGPSLQLDRELSSVNARCAGGVRTRGSATLQAAFDVGPLQLLISSQWGLEWERLGTEPTHYFARYGIAMARDEVMPTETSYLFLAMHLNDSLELRLGAFDEARWFLGRDDVQHVTGPVAMFVASRPASGVSEVDVVLRAGLHSDTSSYDQQWTLSGALLIAYESTP